MVYAVVFKDEEGNSLPITQAYQEWHTAMRVASEWARKLDPNHSTEIHGNSATWRLSEGRRLYIQPIEVL